VYDLGWRRHEFLKGYKNMQLKVEGSISKIQGGLVVTLVTPSKVKHMAPVNRPFYTLQLLFETIFCKTYFL